MQFVEKYKTTARVVFFLMFGCLILCYQDCGSYDINSSPQHDLGTSNSGLGNGVTSSGNVVISNLTLDGLFLGYSSVQGNSSAGQSHFVTVSQGTPITVSILMLNSGINSWPGGGLIHLVYGINGTSPSLAPQPLPPGLTMSPGNSAIPAGVGPHGGFTFTYSLTSTLQTGSPCIHLPVTFQMLDKNSGNLFGQSSETLNVTVCPQPPSPPPSSPATVPPSPPPSSNDGKEHGE